MIESLITLGSGQAYLPDIQKMGFAATGFSTKYMLHHTAANYKGTLIWIGGSITGAAENYFGYLNGTVWTAMPKPLIESRMAHNAVVVGDKLYLWAGITGSVPATKMFSYDFITQVWENLGVIPSTSIFGDCCAIGNKLYYFGGTVTSESDYNPTTFPSYEYDIPTKTWRNLNLALSGRFNLGVAADKDKIYLLGGRRGNNYFKELWEYDTETGTLTAKAAPPQAISARHQFVNYKGWLVMMFGCLDTIWNPNPICYRYHPGLNKWEQWDPAPALSRSFAGCVVRNNDIYLISGYNGSAGMSDSIVMRPT